MAASPTYAAAPQCGIAHLTAAGAVVALRAAGGAGSLLTRLRVQAVGPTQAGVIRIYLYDGTDQRLFMEIPVEAVAASDTVPAFSAEVVLTGGVAIPGGFALRAATARANTFDVFSFLSDL